MKPMIKNISLALIAVLLALTSGCAKPRPSGLSDDQVSAVMQNILKAVDAGDFAAFSQDFSPAMQQSFPEAEFGKLADLVHKACGNFVSLKAPVLSNNGDYALYRFPAQYDNETVYVTISIAIDGTKVEGVWFDSVNLRKLTQ